MEPILIRSAARKKVISTPLFISRSDSEQYCDESVSVGFSVALFWFGRNMIIHGSLPLLIGFPVDQCAIHALFRLEEGWGDAPPLRQEGWGDAPPLRQEGWGDAPPLRQEGWGDAPPLRQEGWGDAPPLRQEGWGDAPPLRQEGWGDAPPLRQEGWGDAPPLRQEGWGDAPPLRQEGWGDAPSLRQEGWGDASALSQNVVSELWGLKRRASSAPGLSAPTRFSSFRSF
uniref:GI10570 n=1 Tax=Solanum tuberosum TaxID=4113 RepID=M1BGQ2_SOLTU